jgi:hypothetical protein
LNFIAFITLFATICNVGLSITCLISAAGLWFVPRPRACIVVADVDDATPAQMSPDGICQRSLSIFLTWIAHLGVGAGPTREFHQFNSSVSGN